MTMITILTYATYVYPPLLVFLTIALAIRIHATSTQKVRIRSIPEEVVVESEVAE